MLKFDPQAMDDAASDAENDLNNLPDEVVNPMADWWYRWYMKAGHKRLGRILVSVAKSNNKGKKA
jgi:hypothetical protein